MTTREMVLFNPIEAVQLAISMKQVVIAVSKEVLKENVDFGKIPGTEKNVLLKPGAERLCSAFKLAPVFEPVSQIEDFERGFFFYRYSCTLVHRETGEVYGRGIGSCNSQENKYGWRWMAMPPSHLDKSVLMTRSATIQELKFAIDKPTTTGKYGKPQEYWDMWKQAIEDGTARKLPNDKARKNGKGEVMETWEMGGVEYRVPNPDVFDLVNTIDKMAQKRALIAATLIATNASEFFTQDMEDFAHDLPKPAAVIVEGEFEDIPQKSVPLTNGRGEPRDVPQPKEAVPAAQTEVKPAEERTGRWADIYKRYTDAHGKDKEQAFRDKAKILFAEGKVPNTMPIPAVIQTVMQALESDANASAIVEGDGMPATWGAVVRAVARHMDGDIEAAKKFIREGLERNAVSADDSADKAKLKLTAILAREAIENGTLEPIEALLAPEDALPVATVAGIDGGTEADPFLDLR
jgi:hypothetical protein